MGLIRSFDHVPQKITTVSFATGIRWAGWGFCEALIPVLTFSISQSYAESGLLCALGNIVFVLLFPVAGLLADTLSMKRFLMLGLCFFIIDGLAYTFAGHTGMIGFIVLANIFDGAAVVSDVVGRSTLIRRSSPKKAIGAMFGFSDTVMNVGLLVGTLIGAVFAPHLPLSLMFSAIVPTTLATILILHFCLPPEPRPINAVSPSSVGHFCREMCCSLIEIPKQSDGFWHLGLSALVLNSLTSVASFLLPIFVYQDGGTTQQILTVSAVGVVPLVFSFALGKIADHHENGILNFGWFIAVLLLIALAFASGRILYGVFILALMTVLTLMNLALERLITHRTDPRRYGLSGALFEAIKVVGVITGPIILGLLVQTAGRVTGVLLIALLVIVFAIAVRTWDPKHRIGGR